jgi:hypothetical protein
MRDQHGRDSRVVVNDVGLGRTRLRVQHLAEVGEFEAVAVDRDDLFVTAG